MNLPNVRNVVHESETQRQFVRLPVPAQVIINQGTYDVRDLSSGGLSAEGVKDEINVGEHVTVRLILPFAAFSLDLNIEAEVLYYDGKEKVVGCQFVNVTPDQVSLLNHVIKSYMAGEIVKSGDLLNVAARENFTNTRKKAATNQTPVVNVKRQVPGLLFVGLLGVIAAAFIGGNIYDSMFVMKSNNAVVQGAELQVRSTAQGVFISKIGPKVKDVSDRQEIGSINGDDVKSPCDCIITQTHRQDGEFVIAGDPIVSLVPKDSTPWIVATMKPNEASRLSLDMPAQITVAGTKKQLAGKVASIKTDNNPAFVGTSRMVHVRIIPDEKLPINLAGRPAKVMFELR